MNPYRSPKAPTNGTGPVSRDKSHTALEISLAFMGGLQFVPLGYLICARILDFNGADEPPAIRIELTVGVLLLSMLPLWVAYRLRRGSGLVAAWVLLVVLIPYICGEISLPIVLLARRIALPLLLIPMLLAFLLHILCYAAALRYLIRIRRMK